MNRDGSTGGAGSGPGSGSGSGSGSTNSGGGSSTGPNKTALRLAVAMVAVGLIGLTLHLTPDLASLALKPPVRLRRDPRWPGLLRGGPG